MKLKKILLFIMFVFVLVLSGCGSDQTPRDLWDTYIEAMNEKNLEQVAEVYYKKDSNGYVKFLEEQNADDYFNFNSLKTKSFTEKLKNEKFYHAEIILNVNDKNGNSDKTIDIYFVKDTGLPWRFISEVNLNGEDLNELGNKPNNAYYNGIIKNDGEYDYKYIYGGTPGTPSDKDYIKIVYPNNRNKLVVIPASIEGAPVKMIGDFAFFDYFRIFATSFSRSKLEQISLPSTLEVIDAYAFYQTKNLKEVNLPSSLKEVKKYAFASSGLERITINVNDQLAYASLEQRTSDDSMTIIGNKVTYVGDTVPFIIKGYDSFNQYEWSTSNKEIATIAENGRLTGITPGVVDVFVTSKEDSSVYTRVVVEVKPRSEKETTTTPIDDDEHKNFKFTINNVFYTGETFTASRQIDKIDVKWTTSDESIAIFENNRIKMLTPGTVTISASVADSPELTTSAVITIKDASEKQKDIDSNMIDNVIPSYSGLTFTGGRDMFVGDILKLNSSYSESEIEWISDNPEIATIGKYDGVIRAVETGTVTIRCKSATNLGVESFIIITIKEPVKGVTFLENALDRLNSLKILHINSINPNSIEFRGTLKLNENVIIYVPAQNIESYRTIFSNYKDNIRPDTELN